MKKTLAICSLLLLAACDPTPAERAFVDQQLPPGCSIKDLGKWGDIQHLIVVDCVGRSTRTSSYPQHQGKSTTPIAVIQID